ncbi:type II toxin-antitoxin system HicB family antitoxin [Fusobacterium gastrosuis]|uniref:type II toxin-antitoxin system HicB family antitoxin n=1 Tax=Fusobacterium gastrosuis TaxID=1755100 RepID=UPI002973C0AA|nr:type II toxin-antitoxin system HicB family antitoxin [Fusobacteriaceae bacterium]MDY3359140.1 type II toxin-antitoxin system HicB family antitoxin [Clostridium celatum]MDY5713848.1 type II toxin-antitoxin system HicB family antitoxin [Fusobacterium gastrosuis]
MNLTYPAIITQEDNVFYIGFVDFKGNSEDDFIYSTYGDSFEDALKMGLEWLILTLNDYEEEKKDFPKATSIVELKKNLKDNQEITYLTFNYEYEKSLMKYHYVKKTLTIPSYLNILATNKNINFSQVLQNALKKELDIE